MPRITPIAITTAVLTTFALSSCSDSSSAGTQDDLSGAKVCVDQYATATVIDDIISGLREGLADAVDQGLEIDVQNPNADTATEQTLAQKFIADNCDVIVPVGTAAAQLMATATKDIPIVFAASSTPVEAKLVESLEEPGGNVTGVSDVLDPVPDIDAMVQLLPDMDTVGLIWKLGDPAGDAQTDAAKAHLDELGIDYVEATITNGSDVTQAADSLVGKVDAIQVPGDTTTISSVAGIIKVADDAELPVFGGSSSAVEAGAVLSSTYDYTVVGKAVADLVMQVLEGADPATLAVVIPDTGGYDLNRTKLDELGIEVPSELSDAALNTY
ncbi:ABC transporter substrate-binding protein [Nocardioides sp.]|uniref:ABC transporter substrate-binding protein n=1 Tax=Nocardioides sp. TaxID=35761 RepID=UPI003D13BC12